MKPKVPSKPVKNGQPASGSVLQQLQEHLQIYLEALKAASENNEYHQLVR